MSAVAPSHTPEPTTPIDVVGPLTAARMRRLAWLYLAVFALGLTIAGVAATPGFQAFGLGLAFPGGGFTHFLTGGTGSVLVHLGCLFLSMLLFVLSLLVWFGTGNQAAPFVVWLGAAVAAAAMGHTHTLPSSWLIVCALAAATLGGGWLVHRRNVARKLARREARRRSIGTWGAVASPVDATGNPVVEELSSDDLAALRYVLDRALQPVGEFNGFDFIDQFQPAAIRYQINNLSYALSLANHLHLPAMRGYLHEGQRRLIEKKKEHLVWKYWALESLWGNFRHDPNPISRDNIMYSGWYSAQIGLFQAATGDDAYAQPGALTLRSAAGAEYVYDFHSLIDNLVDNQSRSEFCLWPCEPNWVYPLCNNQAALGIRLHDRLYGTNYWSDIEAQYKRRLQEEFIDLDGHVVFLRSVRTGFTIPGIQSSSEDAIVAYWMHPLFPDMSRRLWEIARSELFRQSGNGLELIPLKPWLDAGNYRFNTAYALGALGMAARELGDEEAVNTICDSISELETSRAGGVLSYPGCSTWSHTFMLNMRLGRANGLSDLVNKDSPQSWRDGPIIDELSYPDVLPARAVSDGRALDAVLYPGDKPGRFSIGLANLLPNKNYRLEACVDEHVTADASGNAYINVELDGRHEIRVKPVD